jgi:hypothetical protein
MSEKNETDGPHSDQKQSEAHRKCLVAHPELVDYLIYFNKFAHERELYKYTFYVS